MYRWGGGEYLSRFNLWMNNFYSDLPVTAQMIRKATFWLCEWASSLNPAVLWSLSALLERFRWNGCTSPTDFLNEFLRPDFLLCLAPPVCVDMIRTTDVSSRPSFRSIVAVLGMFLHNKNVLALLSYGQPDDNIQYIQVLSLIGASLASQLSCNLFIVFQL